MKKPWSAAVAPASRRTGHLQLASRGPIGFASATAHRFASPVSARRNCSIPRRFRYTYERAIYAVNSFQFTRSARLSLVFRRRR
jgi:hypothetical protein